MNLDPLLDMLALLYPVQRASKTYQGIIVALAVPADVARRVAVPGGVEPDGLHVTLAFLGNVDDQQDATPFLRVARMLAELAAHTAPVEAKFGGPGTFKGLPNGKDACYLSADGPALSRLREDVVQLVERAGLTVDMTHGFTPHVTVAYTAPGATHPQADPPTDPFTFASLGLWLGGHRVTFPWAEAQPLAKADQGHADERQQAQALLAQLGGDLRRLDREDGRLTERGDQLLSHHRAAADGLAQALPAVRGGAVEDAILHHTAQAALAERVSTP